MHFIPHAITLNSRKQKFGKMREMNKSMRQQQRRNLLNGENCG